MSSKNRRIVFPPIPSTTGKPDIDRLLQRTRASFLERHLKTDTPYLDMPIPACIMVTPESDIYVVVFTVMDSRKDGGQVYSKTVELFGPLDALQDLEDQIQPRYGWMDTQDYGELLRTFQAIDSIEAAFSYSLKDLRDIFFFQSEVLEALKRRDAAALVDVCPPWTIA